MAFPLHHVSDPGQAHRQHERLHPDARAGGTAGEHGPPARLPGMACAILIPDQLRQSLKDLAQQLTACRRTTPRGHAGVNTRPPRHPTGHRHRPPVTAAGKSPAVHGSWADVPGPPWNLTGVPRTSLICRNTDGWVLVPCWSQPSGDRPDFSRGPAPRRLHRFLSKPHSVLYRGTGAGTTWDRRTVLPEGYASCHLSDQRLTKPDWPADSPEPRDAKGLGRPEHGSEGSTTCDVDA
ncbi:hypothetical protein YWIDRAFT_08250 [Streptomyces sp. SceaMP-e96]|nr:hypothetical protein YWIDRAFT_08250 [Streptomyces sp. SceaMP-e96]